MRLQEIMVEKEISQYRLEKLSGVSQSHISRMLAGQCRPGLTVMQKLAAALGVTIAELIDGQDQQAACKEAS